MLLYRSISTKELEKLLREIAVRGMYDYPGHMPIVSNLTNVVCTFTEDFRLKDKDHIFYITLDIPNDRIIMKRKASYYVSETTIKNRVWSGRTGAKQFEIEEAYLDQYDINDVVSIKGISHYVDWYIEDYITPVVERYNIVLEQ